MQKERLQEKPSYPVNSVDRTLQLLQLLRDGGSLRLTDAAAELGVALSTAHRLLAMLVYRGFAVQDASKRYVPGPSLGAPAAGISWTRELREIVRPHLEALASDAGESVNLMIRVGRYVRFIVTVEGSQQFRVSDRRGVVLPARLASGGKALLAELEPDVLESLFRGPEAEAMGDALDDDAYAAFLSEIDGVRLNGFATNLEDTEGGLGAAGVAIHDASGGAVAAISIATPAVRFVGRLEQGLAATLFAGRDRIEQELAAQLFASRPASSTGSSD